MSKKYKNTFLGIKYQDKTFYAKFLGLDGKGIFVFRDSDGGTLRLNFDTEAEVFIPQIKRGLFTHKDQVYYVERNPYRQYRRGINSDSHKISSLHKMISLRQPVVDIDPVIYGSFEIQPNRLLDTAKLICDGYSESILTRDFALTLNHFGTEGYSLWYHLCFVGFVTDNTIKVENDIFRQEILDTQRTWCPNYMVV
jgi:hypothetical protein